MNSPSILYLLYDGNCWQQNIYATKFEPYTRQHVTSYQFIHDFPEFKDLSGWLRQATLGIADRHMCGFKTISARPIFKGNQTLSHQDHIHRPLLAAGWPASFRFLEELVSFPSFLTIFNLCICLKIHFLFLKRWNVDEI